MKTLRTISLILALLASLGVSAAQEHGAAPAPAQSQPAASGHQSDLPSGEAIAGADKNSKEYDARSEEEGEENIALKESPMVKKLGSMFGLSPAASYWVFWTFNFLIIAGAIVWMMKSKLVGALRERTVAIRKSMEEARKASQEANAKLSDIQGRLARLDSEVAALKAQAEADFKTEENRIRKSAEEDARRVVEAAEQEIEAAAKSARRDLKAFAAELAVGIAEKKISVDSPTDERLVRTFVDQLGKDGK